VTRQTPRTLSANAVKSFFVVKGMQKSAIATFVGSQKILVLSFVVQKRKMKSTCVELKDAARNFAVKST
jgi:hypothetical protein